MEPEFVPFPKIARLRRGILVSEKIDGTNACVHVSADEVDAEGRAVLRAGSRNRWITPENDNYGFARWVQENADELRRLGPGTHFGEWWGQGIQRRYGLTEKRFSLFNVGRWINSEVRPACCHVVPVMYGGPFDLSAIDLCLAELRMFGSRAAPGFLKPEGVVVYVVATGGFFKQTLENDNAPKSLCRAANGGEP